MSNWTKQVARVLRQSPVFRFLVLGVVILVGFWAARLYWVDMPKRDRAKIASSGKEMLTVIADKLPSDPQSLPLLTDWFPADLPCGLDVAIAPHPFWEAVGLKPETRSHYQYRFHREDTKYTLFARRDSDCDGLFVVYKMEGSVGSVGNVTTNNVGE